MPEWVEPEIQDQYTFNSSTQLHALISSTPASHDWVVSNFGETELISKDGEFWKGMDFDIHVVAVTKWNSKIYKVISKNIHLVDGTRTQFFLVRFNEKRVAEEVCKLGLAGDVAECADSLNIMVNHGKVNAKYFSGCYAGYNEEKNVSMYSQTIISTEIELNSEFSVTTDTITEFIEVD
ncbi:MAG: hypothetical protein JKX76_03420 [Colwellia sp.]|nr:hypothetical protein [Colwellia sp.]